MTSTLTTGEHGFSALVFTLLLFARPSFCCVCVHPSSSSSSAPCLLGCMLDWFCFLFGLSWKLMRLRECVCVCVCVCSCSLAASLCWETLHGQINVSCFWNGFANDPTGPETLMAKQQMLIFMRTHTHTHTHTHTD